MSEKQMSMAQLLTFHDGKMHQISSQGRQAPPEWMAAAIGPDAPGKMVQIPAGDSYTVAEIPGAGTIVRIWMTIMQAMPGSPDNFNDALVLRMYWDGEATPSVEVPFGPFFGVPWGKYTHYVAQPLSCTSGGYNARFPMPFSEGCRIEVANQGNTTCPALFFQVQYLALEEQPSPVRFHAQWRRENPTRPGVPYRVLEAEGRGHFAGMHLFMQNAERWLDPERMITRAKETGSPLAAIFPNALGMGMLEGWESIYVDGETTPSIPGTGNEDYFNSGFYFSKGPYSAPHWGCTVRSYLTSRCAAYRFHIDDAIPFQRSLVVDMDHGYTNQVATDYSSVAYWYQTEPHAPFPVLAPLVERLPTPVGENAIQFAVASSPVWIPVALMGLKLVQRVFDRGKRA